MRDNLSHDTLGHSLRTEFLAVMVIATIAFMAIPIAQGGTGVSWDALNHHIYLGWVADRHRLDIDFLAAGYQGYQYPYLYWPAYKLATMGASGLTAGLVLACLHLAVVPPVWLIAHRCIPGAKATDVVLRSAAVLLAFLSGVVLSQFDSTSNDLLAATPLVWSLALALEASVAKPLGWLTPRSAVVLSGFFAGLAVAFKLSNGPIAVVLAVLWLFAGATPAERMKNAVLAGLASAGGFLLAYGYWGWQLWNHYGNPIYPFYDAMFEPVRRSLGWRP